MLFLNKTVVVHPARKHLKQFVVILQLSSAALQVFVSE